MKKNNRFDKNMTKIRCLCSKRQFWLDYYIKPNIKYFIFDYYNVDLQCFIFCCL